MKLKCKIHCVPTRFKFRCSSTPLRTSLRLKYVCFALYADLLFLLTHRHSNHERTWTGFFTFYFVWILSHIKLLHKAGWRQNKLLQKPVEFATSSQAKFIKRVSRRRPRKRKILQRNLIFWIIKSFEYKTPRYLSSEKEEASGVSSTITDIWNWRIAIEMPKCCIRVDIIWIANNLINLNRFC